MTDASGDVAMGEGAALWEGADVDAEDSDDEDFDVEAEGGAEAEDDEWLEEEWLWEESAARVIDHRAKDGTRRFRCEWLGPFPWVRPVPGTGGKRTECVVCFDAYGTARQMRAHKTSLKKHDQCPKHQRAVGILARREEEANEIAVNK